MNYLKATVALFYKSNGGFIRNFFRTTAFYFAGKSVIAHHGATVKGLKNITLDNDKTLVLGLFPNDFGAPTDRTFLNIKGRLHISGNFDIGRGARISIGKNATVSLASGFINNNCIFAIEHKLTVGTGCAIAWNVQIIDEDYHKLTFEGKSTETSEGVAIGDHVWIGSNVTVLKNVVIPDGCVVASGSLVNRKFTETNCLIGGTPARILRRNVEWK